MEPVSTRGSSAAIISSCAFANRSAAAMRSDVAGCEPPLGPSVKNEQIEFGQFAHGGDERAGAAHQRPGVESGGALLLSREHGEKDIAVDVSANPIEEKAGNQR